MSGPWGPDDPHPLAARRTELVWAGKYGDDGGRRPPDWPALPLRTAEAVGAPAAPGAWRNRLCWGDNRLVMAALLPELRGGLDLVYLDPPFDVGLEFTMPVVVGDGETRWAPDPAVAYRDTWGRGTDGYLQFMAERLALVRELLADTGSLFLHCDHRAGPLLALVCDELFGRGDRGAARRQPGFRNEIVWLYGLGGSDRRTFAKKHDTILWYTKSGTWYFDPPRVPATSQRLRGQDKQCPDTWAIPALNNQAHERTGYPTQKPAALLERIVAAASPPGGLVADFCCGSGTTLAVAERLGRRWLGCDSGRLAIQTARKRLSAAVSQRPGSGFDVVDLGRADRDWWFTTRLAGSPAAHDAAVRRAYGPATPPGTALHVAGPDVVCGEAEVAAAAAAAQAAGAARLVCLAWEYPPGSGDGAAPLPVDRRLIPRELVDSPAARGPFLSLGHVEAELVWRGAGCDVRLVRFVPSLPATATPELAAQAVAAGFDCLDSWAVDFDPAPDGPFRCHWQAWRTRRERGLPTESDCCFVPAGPAPRAPRVRVRDVFGGETDAVVAGGAAATDPWWAAGAPPAGGSES